MGIFEYTFTLETQKQLDELENCIWESGFDDGFLYQTGGVCYLQLERLSKSQDDVLSLPESDIEKLASRNIIAKLIEIKRL